MNLSVMNTPNGLILVSEYGTIRVSAQGSTVAPKAVEKFATSVKSGGQEHWGKIQELADSLTGGWIKLWKDAPFVVALEGDILHLGDLTCEGEVISWIRKCAQLGFDAELVQKSLISKDLKEYSGGFSPLFLTEDSLGRHSVVATTIKRVISQAREGVTLMPDHLYAQGEDEQLFAAVDEEADCPQIVAIADKLEHFAPILSNSPVFSIEEKFEDEDWAHYHATNDLQEALDLVAEIESDDSTARVINSISKKTINPALLTIALS